MIVMLVTKDTGELVKKPKIRLDNACGMCYNSSRMIKHLIKHNAIGTPIYYYTLEECEIEKLRNTQTEEQTKLDEWLVALWQRTKC